MGKLVPVLSCISHKKVRIIPLNGKEKDLQKHRVKAYSSLPQGTKLEAREATKERVKIVITRQQLELLLTSANKFQSGKVSVRFCENLMKQCGKWHPSLASIPEVPNL